MRVLTRLAAALSLFLFTALAPPALAQTTDLPTLLQQLQQAVDSASPDTATADALEADAAALDAQASGLKDQAAALLTQASGLEATAATKRAEAEAARQPDPAAQAEIQRIWQAISDLLGIAITPPADNTGGGTSQPPGDLSAIGDAATPGAGTLVTSGPVSWSLTTDGVIVRDGTPMAETGGVSRIEVVAAYSDASATTVRQAASGSWGSLSWTYDPAWTGAGAQADGWVRDDLYAATPPDAGSGGDTTPNVPAGWQKMNTLPFAGNAQSGADWSKSCGVSNWAEPKLANTFWNYDHVIRNPDSGTVTLLLDGKGSAQVQCPGFGSMAGHYGVVVNAANAHRGGLVGAYIWMYSGYNQGNADGRRFELDFEFNGTNGLQLNYHDSGGHGYTVKEFPGNFDGRDVKLETDFDIPAGWADFYIDGALVYHLTKSEVESKGFAWMDRPMFPIYDVWASTDKGWTGGAYDPAQTTTAVLKSYIVDRR